MLLGYSCQFLYYASVRTLVFFVFFFFFNDTATTEIYTLSLHDALPISPLGRNVLMRLFSTHPPIEERIARLRAMRSEEHTSELQSRSDLVCRLLLEKKNTQFDIITSNHHEFLLIHSDPPLTLPLLLYYP